MAFAGAQPFEAAFCFRGLDPGRFDLALEIEGGAPLRISNVSVHNAPDAMARVARPMAWPYLRTLWPGATSRRATL